MTNLQLIKFIERSAKKLGYSPSTFCRMAVNDGKLYKRMKQGGTVRLPTLSALQSYVKKETKKLKKQKK